ncbi:MAG: type II secretion system F family protein [Phycisphaerales bacterium]|nr:type II secretion system F family protein [Phycisphaerales bacterium]
MVPVLFIVILFPLVFLTLVASAGVGNFRRIRRAAFVRRISFVVRRNLPLASSMFVSSVGEPAGMRQPLRGLSRLLELGLPLSDAIATVWPSCPRVDRSMLRAAEQSGTLPDAIAIIDAKYQRDFELRVNDDQQSFVIPSITFVVLLFCITFAGIFIIPKFVVIFDDFSTANPTVMREIFMTGFTTGVMPSTWYGFLFHGFIAFIVALAALRVLMFLFGGALRRTEFYNNIADSIRWAIPLFRRAAKAEACVATLPTIRIATAAGWPLVQAIDLAATVKTNLIWRQRLQDWANAIRRGTETIAAGKAAGLPDMLLRYLAVGIRDADLEAPLYAAEQYFSLLLERQRRIVRLTLSICATIVSGALVGGICVAVIVSLVQVLDTTSLQWWQI